jgi:formylglycine-generating enzyme required for sulfatase activity
MATGRTFLKRREDLMTYDGLCQSVGVRRGALVALVCFATVLWTGCSTTSGPSEASEGTPLGMVFIPAGSFVMGDGVAPHGVDERDVTLTRDFYLGQYEVTNQEYLDAVQWAYDNGYVTATASSVQDNQDRSTEELLDLDSGYCEIEFDGVSTFSLRDAGHGINPDHPVTEVTWYGAARYCDWLSLREGPPLDRAYEHAGDWLCNGGDPYGAEGYRLPTDAEWEFAAQHNDERAYPWGDEDPDCSLANYVVGFDPCVGWTSPVGSCPAGNSALGLCGMAGNAFEWCNDFWGLLDTDPVTDPVGPGSTPYRVKRGGSFYCAASNIRCAYRDRNSMDYSYNGMGFRVARTVNP